MSNKNPEIEVLSKDKDQMTQKNELVIELQAAAGVETPVDVLSLGNKDDIEAIAKTIGYDPNKQFSRDYLQAELMTNIESRYLAMVATVSDEKPTFDGEVAAAGNEAPAPAQPEGLSADSVQGAAVVGTSEELTLGEQMAHPQQRFRPQQPYEYPNNRYISDPRYAYVVKPETGLVVRVELGNLRGSGQILQRSDIIVLPRQKMEPHQIKAMCTQHLQARQVQQMSSSFDSTKLSAAGQAAIQDILRREQAMQLGTTLQNNTEQMLGR